jgi:multiple sugar transport system permease protein
MSPLAKREVKNGLFYISNWIAGFLLFTLIPMIATLIFSFTNISIGTAAEGGFRFVGLDNYIGVLTDMQLWRFENPLGSMWITIRFGLIALPIGIFLPLGIALLMNQPNLKGTNFFRTLFYMPYIIPFVAAIFLWGGMLNSENGWINRALIGLGMAKDAIPCWANCVDWVYPTYVIMGIWGIGNAMLIFLAGLQNVPTDLYDAAKVDGCNWFQQIWNVTLPMISPIIFYNLVLSVVGLFQYFTTPLVVNQGNGNPGGATWFYNLVLYKTFFTYQLMGYGATMAWILFVVILAVTILIFATAKYWVYYAAESRS